MSYVNPDQLIDSIVQAGVDKANLSIGQMLARGTLSGAILACATTVDFSATQQTGLAIVGAIIFPVGFVIMSKALGPDDCLTKVLFQRLIEAGWHPGDRVVLACAGSTEQRAIDDCHEMGARLSRLSAQPVRVGFISAASPRLANAVESERGAASGARVVVRS